MTRIARLWAAFVFVLAVLLSAAQPAAAVPRAIAPPALPIVINGSPRLGSTLTCVPVGSGATYQWTRGGSNISGETSATHVFASADAGQAIGCTANVTLNYQFPAPTILVGVGARLKGGDSAFTAAIASGAQSKWNNSIGLVNHTGAALTGFRVLDAAWKNSNAIYGGVREVLIDNGGSGCSSAPTVTVSGGSGSGADIRAIVSGGAVTALYIYNPGTGWTLNQTPTLTISGGGCSGVTGHVTKMDWGGDTDYKYDQTVQRSIEYPAGTYTTFTWGGSGSGTVVRGQTVVSDILTSLSIPDGAKFWFHEQATLTPVAPTLAVHLNGSNFLDGITITSPGSGLWAPSYSLAFGTGAGTGIAANAYTYQGQVVYTEVTNQGSTTTTGSTSVSTNLQVERPIVLNAGTQDGSNAAITNVTSSLTAVSAQTVTVGATALLGMSPSTTFPAVGIIGDSIANGFSGGDSIGDANGSFGFISRLVSRLGGTTIKLTLPGDYLSTFVANPTRRLGLLAQTGALTSIVNEYGVNDVMRGDSLATIQANMISAWTMLHAYAPKVIQTTITPHSTSSDNWTTVSGQTAAAGFGPGSVQAQLNDWLRDGAPISNGAAVAVGTVGALRAGDSGHPLSKVADVAGQIESSVNSGLFLPWASVNKGITSDGTHPRDEGHALINGRVGTLTQAAGTGYVTTAPTMSFTGGGIPIATATLSGGAITGVTAVQDGGKTYDFVPPVNILAIGGAGSGAKITPILSGGTSGTITGYTVNTAGSGYTNGVILSIAGATPPQGHEVLNGDGTLTPVLDWPGGGLTSAPTVVLTGGDGSGAAVTATLKQLLQASDL